MLNSTQSQTPVSAGAGEGCRRQGEGILPQGLRPGLRSCALKGLANGHPQGGNFSSELLTQDKLSFPSLCALVTLREIVF
jgi:hypothetical protein